MVSPSPPVRGLAKTDQEIMINLNLSEEEFVEVMQRLDATDLEDTMPALWKKLDREWLKVTINRFNDVGRGPLNTPN